MLEKGRIHFALSTTEAISTYNVSGAPPPLLGRRTPEPARPLDRRVGALSD